ncbi:MAG: M48 family metalloprotease [Acidobacteria bacterium]|nr:M48 family metalloprotease [Acidobacteriota bacterium]
MNETKATRYQRLRRRARVIEAACAGAALALLALTPAGGRLGDAVSQAARGAFGGGAAAALVLFVLAVVLVVDLATLPASLYVALRLNRRYRRDAELSPDDVLGTHVQALAVMMPAAVAAAAIVAGSRVAAGSWWWVMAGPLLAAGLVSALHLAPALLSRVAGVQPIERPGLVHRLEELARRANVPIARILEWRVGRAAGASALVTGAGAGRRVLVASELVQDWSDDEIAVVVAHELGHVARGDLWRALLVDVAILWAALLASQWALSVLPPSSGTSSSDLAALPLIALVAVGVWLAFTPVRHACSRAQERRADRFALALTGRPDAFTAAVRRLGSRHLAEERPSLATRWLYHRHPSVAERLDAAESFRRDQGPEWRAQADG